jgi:hypothetical protein
VGEEMEMVKEINEKSLERLQISSSFPNRSELWVSNPTSGQKSYLFSMTGTSLSLSLYLIGQVPVDMIIINRIWLVSRFGRHKLMIAFPRIHF